VRIEYAANVARCIEVGSYNRTSIGLLEAGTGISKTPGDTIPLPAYAALESKRAAISTTLSSCNPRCSAAPAAISRLSDKLSLPKPLYTLNPEPYAKFSDLLKWNTSMYMQTE
jgi:hypothetical protein